MRTNDLGQCGATFALAALVATDNCGSVTVTSNAPATFAVGTNVVTWTVVDSNGNTNTCTQNVIITDSELPVINTPVNITVNAAAGACGSNVTFSVTATDNCGTNTVTSTPASGSLFPVGTTTVTNTVTDIHGNTNTSTFTVTVVDAEAPLITCPAEVRVPANSGFNATNVALGVPVVSDNCGVPIVTSNAPAVFGIGTNTVTWTVTDGHGNTNTCTQKVVVYTASPVADVAVFLSGPTNSVTQGNAIVYTNLVINYGPSTATNVVLKNLLLPTNVVFVSASGGGVYSNATHTVTWPKVTTLANGASTNYTVTVTITNVITSNLILTNIASATSSTADPNPTNNTGVLPVSQWNVTVVPADLRAIGARPVFNPQTGLFQQYVTVTNSGGTTVAGMRLTVLGLPVNVFLQNATGTNAGRPFVQYNVPLDPGSNVVFFLEFLSVARTNFTDSFLVEAVLPAPAPSTNGTVITITRIFTETYSGVGQPHTVVEFTSIPGRRYIIIYSDDTMVTWKVATPTVTANANSYQWIDDGPPKTESAPSSVPSRFYRVILVP